MPSLFTSLMRALLVVGLALFPSSCCPQKVTLKAVKTAWEVVEPRYREYVTNDPLLSADARRTRLDTATLMTKALNP